MNFLVAENVLNRQFSPQTPNQAWGVDITVDSAGLGLPGGSDRPVLPPGSGLGHGSAHEESPGDPGAEFMGPHELGALSATLVNRTHDNDIIGPATDSF